MSWNSWILYLYLWHPFLCNSSTTHRHSGQTHYVPAWTALSDKYHQIFVLYHHLCFLCYQISLLLLYFCLTTAIQCYLWWYTYSVKIRYEIMNVDRFFYKPKQNLVQHNFFPKIIEYSFWCQNKNVNWYIFKVIDFSLIAQHSKNNKTIFIFCYFEQINL